MHKTAICIILLIVALVIGLAVMLLVVLPEYQGNKYEISTEMIAFENITFKGTSGEANNSIILILRNAHSRINVVLEQANVTGYGVNEIFSITPEEKNIPRKTQRQVTLPNVGWTEGHEYKIELITSKGNKFRAKVTA